MTKYLGMLVLLFCLPSFGAVHLGYKAAKAVSYPARHPRKTAEALAKPPLHAAKLGYDGLQKVATFLF
jgi:hypothetical protein